MFLWFACASPTPPAPDPTPAPVVRAPPAPLSVDRLPDAIRDELTAIGEARGRVKDAAAFAEVWRRAQRLEVVLTMTFQQQVRGGPCSELGADRVALSGFALRCVAEGRDVEAWLPPEPWVETASGTPETEDDQIVALFAMAYGAASERSFPHWMVQTSDLGGCSGLGTGTVVESLLAADRALAAGDRFAPEIASLREAALSELDPDLATHCRPDGTAMPADALQAEARRVLAETKLSPEERRKIEEKLPLLVGEAATGG